MRVEYSKRALADLRQLAAHYARSGNSAIADGIAEHIQRVIAGIAASPLSSRAVVGRPGVRVALLPSYRYKIFYRVGRRRHPDSAHPLHLPSPIRLTLVGRPLQDRCRGYKDGQRHPHPNPLPLAGEGREGACRLFLQPRHRPHLARRQALEYGIVGINEGIISTDIAPFRGMKESGIDR